MPRTMSAEALEAMFAQQTSEIIFPLVEIDEQSLASPIRVVNNTEQVTWRGNTYLPSRFAIAVPSEENGSIPQVSLAIDNINRVIRDAIELAQNQPTMYLTYIRADAHPDNDPAEAGPFEFVMESAEYDVNIATIQLRFTEVYRLRYPQHSFIPAFFPDLFD